MIKSIIVDDELKSIISLKWELSHFSDEVSIIKTFTSPFDAIEYLKQHQIDCLFLDIDMPDMDGFQLLSHFEQRDFCVIFVTAFDNYAIKAIKKRAFDYLLKPVDKDELYKSIVIIKDYLMSGKSNTEQYFFNKSKPQHKIKISVNGKIMLFKPEDILYCKSEGNYCFVNLSHGDELLVTKNLKEIESVIDHNHFFRVHNSYLVNLNKIQSLIKSESCLILNNGKKIPISRSRKTEVIQKLTHGI